LRVALVSPGATFAPQAANIVLPGKSKTGKSCLFSTPAGPGWSSLTHWFHVIANSIPAPHPGETARQDVLAPLGMSVDQLAKAPGITATRLNDVVRGRRGVTADTALRLARYLGTPAEFWLGLQLEYDLRTARQTRQREIEKAVQPRSAAAWAAGGRVSLPGTDQTPPSRNPREVIAQVSSNATSRDLSAERQIVTASAGSSRDFAICRGELSKVAGSNAAFDTARRRMVPGQSAAPPVALGRRSACIELALQCRPLESDEPFRFDENSGHRRRRGRPPLRPSFRCGQA